MIKFKTTYKKSVTAFKLYNKCFKGQETMEQIRKANKFMRRIKDEILVDIETALTVKNEQFQKETDLKKRKELGDKLNKEGDVLMKKEIEIEVMPEEIEALKTHLNGIKPEDLKDLETNTILNFDLFIEDLEKIK